MTNGDGPPPRLRPGLQAGPAARDPDGVELRTLVLRLRNTAPRREPLLGPAPCRAFTVAATVWQLLAAAERVADRGVRGHARDDLFG